MKDLHNNLKFVPAIAPQSSADDTPIVSAIVDRAGYEAVEFAIHIGSVGDADATFAVLLEDGDDAGLSDAAAVPDKQLLGTEAAAAFQFDDDNETRKLGYVGPKRYLRLTVTPTGNSGTPSAAFVSAMAVLGAARHAPVA